MEGLNPWLSLSREGDSVVLGEFTDSWQDLRLPVKSRPSLIVTFGRKCKSDCLRSLLDNRSLGDAHGKILLWRDRASMRNVFVDYELDCKVVVEDSQALRKRRVKGVAQQSNVANLFLGRVLSNFADVVCFFAPDLGGLKGVARLLGEQIAIPGTPRTDMTDSPIWPHIIVICKSGRHGFDPIRTRIKLLKLIENFLRKTQDSSLMSQTPQLENWIEAQVGTISVFGYSPNHDDAAADVKALRNFMEKAQKSTQKARHATGMEFRRDHLYALLDECVKAFCQDHSAPFSFALASRPAGFDLKSFDRNVSRLLEVEPQDHAPTPNEHRVSDRPQDDVLRMYYEPHVSFHSPLLASSIVLASYPPRSHLFPMPWLYKQLYAPLIQKAAIEKIHGHEKRDRFLKSVSTQVEQLYHGLQTRRYQDAKAVHMHSLRSLRTSLDGVRSNALCLSCLLETPERFLFCGHSLCDTCVRIWGKPVNNQDYTFELTSCPLCGAENEQVFRILPPTAGIRLLSLDGGGIRGVIPLVILAELDRRLQHFGVPLRSYFDFVCGTSAGGLIALGLFVMQWRTALCLDNFKSLAKKTFGGTSLLPLFKLQQMLISWLRDYRYSSVPIEEAFCAPLQPDDQLQEENLFKSMPESIRVAVSTTVTAKQPDTYLLSNYNGGQRLEARSYKLFRPMESNQGVRIGQAARATSAAPWLFAPVNIPGLGLCQDGGLHHNNPIHLADWEARAMWSNRGLRDFELTIGTGYSDGVLRSGRGFLRRVFDSFMHNMDGQKIHKEYMNGRTGPEQERIHRVNIHLGSQEPALNDVDSINALELRTLEKISEDKETAKMLADVRDAAIASMFCFELDSIPIREDLPTGQILWRCTGHIFCRLPLNEEGRRRMLKEMRLTRSHFLLSEGYWQEENQQSWEPQLLGQPHGCIGEETNEMTPYRRWLSFCLTSLDSQIGITLSGITSRPRSISGLPKTANGLIRSQGLNAPFGRSDHQTHKVLPTFPRKRKHCQIS